MLSFQLEGHKDLILVTDFLSTGTVDVMINFSFVCFKLLYFIYLKDQGNWAAS